MRFLFLFVIINVQSVFSQQSWQSWNAVTVQADVARKWSLRTGYLQAHRLEQSFPTIFSQWAFQASYAVNKRWSVQSGVQYFMFPGTSAAPRTRLYVRAAHTVRVAEVLNWTNSMRIETNSKNENRFRQRVILSSRLALRKRMEFMRLTPSIAYSLFYNIGGNPIRYFDEDGAQVARQSPNGFHRGRFTVNLNSKINEYLRINLYYMRQDEFNLLVQQYREMNVYDPVRKRIQRPFNEYNTVGLNLQIVLDKLF